MSNIKVPDDMQVGTVFDSNGYGKYEIIYYGGYNDVRIRFLDTGYETIARSYNVRVGAVRDSIRPIFKGVGYMGEGPYKSRKNNTILPEYKTWGHMLERCYPSTDDQKQKYKAYSNCIVCEEWHNFQNFAEWYYKTYPKDGNVWHLDKDKLAKGGKIKIYSPETCCWLTQKENSQISTVKKFKVICPDGILYEGSNISEFSKKHGLDNSCLSRVVKGKSTQHKGWTKA